MAIIRLLFLFFILQEKLINGYIQNNSDASKVNFNRNILQNDKNCKLSDDDIDKLYDKTKKIWMLTDSYISNKLNNDIQLVVDCAYERDYILFNTGKLIIPNDTITINKNIVFTYFIDETDYENGVFPETKQKSIFTCPEDKAIFDIKTNNFTVANIEIIECVFSKNSDASPIIFSNECDEYKNGTIKFHHVNFKMNKNHLKPGCFSTDSLTCSSLEMINVNFDENESGGIVIGNLLPINTLTDVKMTNNKFLRGKSPDPPLTILMQLESESILNIDNLRAINNTGLIISASNGSNIDIKNSIFDNNSGSLIYPTLPSCIIGNNTKILISKSIFVKSKPIFIEIENSEIEIEDSLFQNIGHDGFNATEFTAIRTIESDTTVKNSNFSYNAGGENSGALYNEESNITIINCVFYANSAKHGGAIYNRCKEKTCQMNISDSFFMENTAVSKGGAISNEESDITISNCMFQAHSAKHGGAIYNRCKEKTCQMNISDSFFIESTAESIGGALSNEEIEITISKCIFHVNIAEYGGAVYDKCAKKTCQINISDSFFIENSASIIGGALRFKTDYHGNISNSVFYKNYARLYGGAIGVTDDKRNSKITLYNSSLCENCVRKNSWGGAIFANSIENGNVQVILNNITMYNNSAFNGNGGGIYGSLASIHINGGTISGNYAEGDGGGIAVSQSEINIESAIIANNSAGEYGGGIYGQTVNRKEQISIKYSVLSENSAKIYGGAMALHRGINLYINNTELIDNICDVLGGAIYHVDSISEIEMTIFSNNKAQAGGALVISGSNEESFVMIKSSYFISQQTKAYGDDSSFGGAISIYGKTNTTLINSEFKKNTVESDKYAFGGAIYFESGNFFSNITISNCSFESNVIKGSGSACYFSGLIQLWIFDSDFVKNEIISDNYGGAIFVVGTGWVDTKTFNELNITGTVNIRNLTQQIYHVEGISRDNKMPYSIIQFENVRFEGNIASLSKSGALCIAKGIFADFKNCTFLKNIAKNSGAIYVFNSELYCNKCEFIENDSTLSGGSLHIYNSLENEYQEVCLAVLKNSTFKSNLAKERGGAVYLSGDSTVLYLLGDNRFEKNSAKDGGAIYMSQNGKLYSENSTFIENSANFSGGAISASLETNKEMKILLKNCNFFKNFATIGGVIFMMETTPFHKCNANNKSCSEIVALSLRNVTFIGNKADKAGGIMMISNPYIVEVECDINNEEPTDFSKNGGFAKLKIKKTDKKSLFNTSSCSDWNENDVTDGYGHIYASYSKNISMVLGDNNEKSYEFSVVRDNETHITYILSNFSSGTNLPSFNLSGLDDFGQGPAFGLNPNLFFEMSSPDELFVGKLTNYYVELILKTQSFPVYGTFGQYMIRINSSYPEFKEILLLVDIRECEIGEEFMKDNNYCNPCDAVSYNFKPNISTCNACPEFAICSSVFPRPMNNYWHAGPCSTTFYECIVSEACKRNEREHGLYNFTEDYDIFNSTNLDEYQNLQCAEGYEGPLCGSCAGNYGRIGSNECTKCHKDKKPHIFVYFCLVGLWFLGLSAVEIKGNLSSALSSEKYVEDLPCSSYEVESPHTISTMISKPIYSFKGNRKVLLNSDIVEIYLRMISETFKVCINYLQVTAIAMAINVNWSYPMKIFLEILDFVGGISGTVTNVSLDCLISKKNDTRTIIRVVLSIIWPLFIFAIISFFWSIYSCIKKLDLRFLRRRILLSSLVISYISYISVTKYLVRVLYCKEITISDEGKPLETIDVWLEDTKIDCFSGKHKILTVFSILLIVIFSIGFPSSVIISLLRLRYQQRLDDIKVAEIMGFLYRTYRIEYIFWDSIVMFRKSILAIIVVSAYSLGGNQQGILSVFVLIIALCIQFVFSPFKEEFNILNNCEGASLFVSTMTFTSGLLFNEKSTVSTARLITAIIIIASNMCLLMGLIAIMLIYLYKYFKTKLVLSDKVDENDHFLNVIRKFVKSSYRKAKPKVLEIVRFYKKAETNDSDCES